jgi:hypothetical protein
MDARQIGAHDRQSSPDNTLLDGFFSVNRMQVAFAVLQARFGSF